MANIPDISQLIERVSKIKLSGGVVGKLSTVLLVACFTFGSLGVAAAYVTGGVWVTLVIAALLFILVLVLGILMIRFANKNPQAALYEGAEFLLHEQMSLAMKGRPAEIPFKASDLTTNPEQPPRLIDATEEEENDEKKA